MTYVEFFDRISSENISACLTYAPDRVIYIGYNANQMERYIAYYTRVFKDRGQNIEFLYKTVTRSNLDNAVEVLTQIVDTYDDCVFDITGGEEILNLALGVVYSRYPGKNIQIHKFNLRSNAIYDCDKDGKTIYKDLPVLSIEENVRIYGGDVVYGDVTEDKTYKWDLNPEFLKDVETIWSICKKDVRYWNMQMCIFEAAMNVGTLSEDGLGVVANCKVLEQYLIRHKGKYNLARSIIYDLKKAGLITYFDDSDGETLAVAFKDLQIRKCLTKAGQALEMKVYVTVRGLLEKDGSQMYTDALNGVVIDWDGKFHDEETELIYDTENEVDILLMHNVIPIFISCKNGIVTSDELYKLNTVAERFGGLYSKKVLVANSVDAMGEAGEYLRQRAADMGIRLIERVQNMTDAALQKELKNLWSRP